MPGWGKRRRVHRGDAAKWAGRSEGLSASVCLPKSPQEVQRRPGGLEMRKGVGRGWQSGTSCCEGGLSPRAPESTADAGLEPCRARWLRVWPLRWSTASAHSQLQVCILNALNDLQVYITNFSDVFILKQVYFPLIKKPTVSLQVFFPKNIQCLHEWRIN